MKKGLLSLILAAAFASQLQAAQIPVADDTSAIGYRPTTSYGNYAFVVVSPRETGYLDFDLSSLPQGITSAQIGQATVKLFIRRSARAGTISVKAVSAVWDENTLTFRNQPTVGAEVSRIVVPVKSNDSFAIVDVTQTVRDWIANPGTQHGFALTTAEPGVRFLIDSKENPSTAHEATLEVTLTATGGIGPKGDKGDMGDKGDKGDKGDAGTPGGPGAPGAPGGQGPQGDPGLPGAPGGPGPKGDPGTPGGQGLKGDPGDPGAPGMPGPIGPAGPVGPIGPTGGVGPAGSPGSTGPAGVAGPAGPAGSVGPVGPAGAIGPQGPKGDPGANGQGVPTGGTAGQVLAKVDATNYNTQWITPAAGGSGAVSTQLRADKVGGTSESLPVATSTTPPTIAFNNVLTAPTLGSWDGTTYTVGATGAGLYFIQAAVLTPDASPVTNTVGVSLVIEVNNAGYGTTAGGVFYGIYPNINAYTPAGTKGRGEISKLVYLNAGDTFKIRGVSANSSTTSQPISTVGASNVTVVKLN